MANDQRPETTDIGVSVLVFREGGGLAFLRCADGSMRVLMMSGREKLDEPLLQLGSCGPEHAAFVAQELGKDFANV